MRRRTLDTLVHALQRGRAPKPKTAPSKRRARTYDARDVRLFFDGVEVAIGLDSVSFTQKPSADYEPGLFDFKMTLEDAPVNGARESLGFDILIGYRGPYPATHAPAPALVVGVDMGFGPDETAVVYLRDGHIVDVSRERTPAEERRHAFLCKTEGLPETSLDPERARELAVHQSAGISEGLRETRLNVERLRRFMPPT